MPFPMRVRGLGCLLALCAVCSNAWLTAPVSAASAQTVLRASPKAFTVQLSDVTRAFGTGFRTGFSREVTNRQLNASAALSSVKGIDYARHGRITGYYQSFARTGATGKGGKYVQSPGVSSVISGVDVFKDSSGPVWEFDLAAKQKRPITRGLVMHVSLSRSVGQQTLQSTFTEKTTASSQVIQGASIAFREGRYTGTVSISGTGSAPLPTVIALAKLMDERIKRGG